MWNQNYDPLFFYTHTCKFLAVTCQTFSKAWGFVDWSVLTDEPSLSECNNIPRLLLCPLCNLLRPQRILAVEQLMNTVLQRTDGTLHLGWSSNSVFRQIKSVMLLSFSAYLKNSASWFKLGLTCWFFFLKKYFFKIAVIGEKSIHSAKSSTGYSYSVFYPNWLVVALWEQVNWFPF